MVKLDEVILAKETFQFMQPFIISTRLFGLCPITYRTEKGKIVLKWSVGYGIYSYFLGVALATAAVIGLVHDLSLDENHSIRMKHKKTRYITSCDISIVILIVFVGVILTTPSKLKQLWRIFNCFNKMDRIIALRHTPHKHHQTSLHLITSVLIFFTLVLIFDITIWMALSKDTSGFYLKNYCCFYLLYYIAVMQEVYYWHLVYAVRIRMVHLNQSLLTELEKLSLGGENKRSGVVVFRSVRVDRVGEWCQYHKKLCEAVEAVNAGAGIGVVLIMLSCLLHLIVTPYFCLLELSTNQNPLFISLQIAWFVAHICRLLIIIEPCQLCLYEIKTTVSLLCDLLASTVDEEVKQSMIVFAMQLSHCKIKFTCAGLVTLNRSIITTIAGAVTTYLVILFQFNNS